MACFVVPAVEAVVTTVAEKVIAKKEKDSAEVKTRFSDKLKWLNNMLWGGSALLAFEHVWHGEIVPYFPFLTNSALPGTRAEMLHEMATAGSTMALLVTGVWACAVAVSISLERKAAKAEEEV